MDVDVRVPVSEDAVATLRWVHGAILERIGLLYDLLDLEREAVDREEVVHRLMTLHAMGGQVHCEMRRVMDALAERAGSG